MGKLTGVLGLFAMIAIAYALSDNRKKVNYRVIISGLLLQIVFAFLILKTALGQRVFQMSNVMVEAILSQSDKGAQFLFGDNYTEHFFAFKVLPTIIFASSLSYLLFHWGILQRIVEGLAKVMSRFMGVSGAESLAAAANIFLGQTEAPLFIKPYIKSMTRSEILCLMAGGMANIAGGVLVAFVGMGISAGHLVAASFMSAPAAILLSKIMVPETEQPKTMGQLTSKLEVESVNSFDAVCRGAADGLMLALNVGAMLIAVIALVALTNLFLEKATMGIFGEPVTLQKIFGYAFYPFAILMGVPSNEAFLMGGLLGEKTVVNEFVAYIHLADLMKAQAVSPRTAEIMTYAMCGFANFSSIAIQIGGIGSLEPTKKRDFAQLGLKSMICGTLASFMTACIASVFI
ncbi:MAG: NupC/NupG family nucleoside CNT transporter [Oligoflexales bacterium]